MITVNLLDKGIAAWSGIQNSVKLGSLHFVLQVGGRPKLHGPFEVTRVGFNLDKAVAALGFPWQAKLADLWPPPHAFLEKEVLDRVLSKRCGRYDLRVSLLQVNELLDAFKEAKGVIRRSRDTVRLVQWTEPALNPPTHCVM